MLEENSLGVLGEGVSNAAVNWQEPRATAAPGSSKGSDGPTRSYNPIIRDRGHARPQSASWHGLTPLWGRESLQRSTHTLLAKVLLNLLV